ncbi:hypothetical protein LX36DRAFT_303026 [Colletotrichum falcatum]|nr:hypothetical protein LX36DRAFT_303026 [Colletotrichum falcatum]
MRRPGSPEEPNLSFPKNGSYPTLRHGPPLLGPFAVSQCKPGAASTILTSTPTVLCIHTCIHMCVCVCVALAGRRDKQGSAGRAGTGGPTFLGMPVGSAWSPVEMERLSLSSHLNEYHHVVFGIYLRGLFHFLLTCLRRAPITVYPSLGTLGISSNIMSRAKSGWMRRIAHIASRRPATKNGQTTPPPFFRTYHSLASFPRKAIIESYDPDMLAHLTSRKATVPKTPVHARSLHHQGPPSESAYPS